MTILRSSARFGAVVLMSALVGCSVPAGTPVAPTPSAAAEVPREFAETNQSDIQVSGRRVGDFSHTTFSGKLFASDGTVAVITVTAPVQRLQGGTIECGGETYRDAAYTSTVTGQAVMGSADIAGFGSLELVVTTHIGAFPEETGPPFCETFGGTYKGSGGRLADRTGTVTFLISGESPDSLVMTMTLD